MMFYVFAYSKFVSAGVCNLCNGGVRFVRNNDKNRLICIPALSDSS